MNQPEMSAEDLEVGRSCQRAVMEAFELSLRWLAIVTDAHTHRLEGERCVLVSLDEPTIKRYGPFATHNDAEFYASQITCCSESKVDVVEMHDIAVHNKRMFRWFAEMDEVRKYKSALGRA